MSSKMVKKWPFLTPIWNLVFLAETRKRGWGILVCWFGAHIVHLPVAKPYPIWTRIYEVAERQRKKIENFFFSKNRKKSIFSSYTTWSISTTQKDLGPQFKPPTARECSLLWCRNKAKTRLLSEVRRSQFRDAVLYGSPKSLTPYIFLKTWT